MEPLDDTIAILNGAIADAGKLLNLHVELLRAEMKKNAGFTKKIAIFAFLMILGLIPAFILLALSMSDFLQAHTQLQEWQCKLIVSLTCFAGCIVLAYNARSQLIQLQDK